MSTPFTKKPMRLTNPDGSTLDVFGWGDQYYARFETPDGYTVVRDPATGYYNFAARASDGRLAATPFRVEQGRGRPEGISRHVREDVSVVREKVAASTAAFGHQRWRERRAQRKAQRQRAASERAALPSRSIVGDYTGLCLLVQFPDLAGTISPEEVSDFCNKEGYSAHGNNGSVRDYFLHNSLRRLRYTNEVVAYYTAIHPRDYYTDPSIPFTQRAGELIREALDALVATGYDFSRLTKDSEGYVYALNMLYAGFTTNDWSQGLWPHQSGLWPNYEIAGGVKFRDYQIASMGTELALHAFVHENGHMLCDFPDLYDYGFESYGVGNYCLMAYGTSSTNPAEVCAYLKRSAGWASSVVPVTEGMHVALSCERNDFVIHEKPGSPTEYFIIENRQQTGRDAGLPSAGLAIWHVDELGSNGYEQMTPSQHYECALVQADGRCDLEHNANTGDSSDLFAAPANTQFSDDTTPSARWWDGTRSGLHLARISAPSGMMSFEQSSSVVWKTDDIGQSAAAVSWQLGDVDGDGQQELVQLWSCRGQLGLIVYGWAGDAMRMRWFSEDMGEGSGALDWRLADINGDGRAELIQCWNYHGKLGVIVYGWSNNAMRRLWRTGDMGQGSGAVAWQTGDFTGDGRAELVQCWDNHGKLGVILYGWRRGSLQTLWSSGDMQQGSGAVAWQVGDIDGDGRAELLQLWNHHGRLGAIIYGWTGHSLETRWQDGELGQNSDAIAWQLADFDGDGRAELIQLRDVGGKIGAVVYGYRDGALRRLWTTDDLGHAGAALSWQACDTDLNGNMELVKLWNNSGQLGMVVYAWNGAALTELRTCPETGEAATAIRWLSGNIRGVGAEVLQLRDNQGQLGLTLFSAS